MRRHAFRGRCGPGCSSGYGYDRRGGFLSGGCRFTAGWLGLPTWVVLAFFIILFLTIGWPALLIYLACAVLLRPASGYDAPSGAPGYAAPGAAPGMDFGRAARDVRDRAQDIEVRIARMESHVTSREFDFDRRLAASKRRKDDA